MELIILYGILYGILMVYPLFTPKFVTKLQKIKESVLKEKGKL